MEDIVIKKICAESSLVVLVIIAIISCLLGGCGDLTTAISPGSSSEGTKEDIPVSLKYAEPFSEGIAWVLYEDPSGNEQIGWLHTDGHIDQPFPVDIVIRLKEDYGRGSGWHGSFSGGYTYITTGDAFERGSQIPDRFLILNEKGEITAQSPDDGNSYEIIAGGDGTYLVKQPIRSMTEKEDRYGLITADGVWLYECAICEEGSGHPLSRTEDAGKFPDVDFEYLGDGIFSATYWRNMFSGPPERAQTVLYNVYEKKAFYLSGDDRVWGQFYDDMIAVTIDDQLYMLSTAFELTPVAVDTIDIVIYSEGIIFTAERNGVSTLVKGKFYKPDGTVVADLLEYELLYESTRDLYRYCEGYAAIVVRGADGGGYLAILDLDGNFTFEPKKIAFASNIDLIGTFSSGVIAVQAYENYETQIINIAGEEVPSNYIDGRYIGNFDFRDGYAYDEKNLRYIGIDGKPLALYV